MNTHPHNFLHHVSFTIDTSDRACVWKDIPSEPQFEASDTGLIRCKATHEVIRPYLHRRGYLHVVLNRHRAAPDRETAPKAVHRLVCEAFYGPCPEGYETLHADDEPTNNTIGNISWAPRSENIVQRWRENIRKGLQKRHGYDRLDREAIRKLYVEGAALKTVASLTGCSNAAVKHVLSEEGIALESRNRGNTTTRFDHADILRLHLEGRSQRAIAKAIGCTQATVSHALRKKGARSKEKRGRSGNVPVIDRSAIVKLSFEGLYHREIAGQLGCDRNSVSRILKELRDAGRREPRKARFARAQMGRAKAAA